MWAIIAVYESLSSQFIGANNTLEKRDFSYYFLQSHPLSSLLLSSKPNPILPFDIPSQGGELLLLPRGQLVRSFAERANGAAGGVWYVEYDLHPCYWFRVWDGLGQLASMRDHSFTYSQYWRSVISSTLLGEIQMWVSREGLPSQQEVLTPCPLAAPWYTPRK